MDYKAINDFIQKKLANLGLEKVKATEAAEWLNEAGLLTDNANKAGAQLRKFIDEEITGAAKEKNLWFIYLVKDKTTKKAVKTKKVIKKEECKKAAAKKASEKGKETDQLKACYDLINNQKALSGKLDGEPVELIAEIRDCTRISLMQIAGDVIEGYSIKTNMLDTISMLYENKHIGKVTVQSLQIIRKIGNLAQYEKEQLTEANSKALAEIVCNAFNIYYDEMNQKGLIK